MAREVGNRLKTTGIDHKFDKQKMGGKHTEIRAGLAGVWSGQRSLGPDRPKWWLSSKCWTG